MNTPLRLFPHDDETIEGVGRALRAGRTTCAAVLEHCFHQIDLWDERVQAWVFVDRAGAMRRARELDAELAAGRCRGPLHGIPLGVKDIIDVAGMPTAAGFPPWRDRVADRDARLVADLRQAGAVILGKTVTTMFAWVDPPGTRNPWNLDRTPGGSSSGSAAAVATGMCLGALGTQTGGSVIRPASFCGVAGVKTGYGLLPMDGIVPLAPSLDHVGMMARTCRDLALMLTDLEAEPGHPEPPPREPIPTAEVEAAFGRPLVTFAEPLRLGRLRGFYDRKADPAAREAVDRAVAALTAAGALVVDVPDEDAGLDFEAIIRDHRTIMAAEAGTFHRARHAEQPNEYAPRIRDLVEEGLATPVTRYVQASLHWREGSPYRTLQQWRAQPPLWARLALDAFVTPSTPGPAPDRSTTGDPVFQSPWSFLGLPSVTFPCGLSPDGLPLGLQLVGHPNGTRVAFLDRAAWCAEAVRQADPGPNAGGA